MGTQGNLSSSAWVDRAGGATWHSLSPGGGTRFLEAGAAGVPDFYEDRGSRGDSAPLHRHPWPSWEYVVDGDVLVVVDGEEHRLGAGDCVYVPPGVPHTFRIESDTARMLGVNMSDGRFEELQRRAAPIFQADGGPDMAKVQALAEEVDVEILGPPLPPG